jgi:fatty-acyl-CoA synthase
LIRLGVKPGDRVATIAWNTHRHSRALLRGLGHRRRASHDQPTLLSRADALRIGHAEDRILFFDTTFLKAVQLVAAECRSIQR